jgi:hypothetical protein
VKIPKEMDVGGIIVRVALGHEVFAKYTKKLHTFVSFNCPHLGLKCSERKGYSIGRPKSLPI